MYTKGSTPNNRKGESKAEMVHYLYRMEWNRKDKMLFSIQKGSEIIALIWFEDRNRPGELMRDFAYCYPNYYTCEEDWTDFRNLISSSIFILDKTILDDTEENKTTKDDLLCIAEGFVETRGNINVKYEILYDKEVCQLYDNYWSAATNIFPLIKYLYACSEVKESIFEECISKRMDHLSQI